MTNRQITIDANDKIVAEGHQPLGYGNPKMLAHITLAPTHEDYRTPVGGRIQL